MRHFLQGAVAPLPLLVLLLAPGSAFEQTGIDPAFYAHRQIALDEVTPWSHIADKRSDEFLRGEYERMMEILAFSPGINPTLSLSPRLSTRTSGGRAGGRTKLPVPHPGTLLLSISRPAEPMYTAVSG